MNRIKKTSSKKTFWTKKRILWFLVLLTGLGVLVIGITSESSRKPEINPTHRSKIACQGETTAAIKDMKNTITQVPLRTSLTADTTQEKLTITGIVTDTHCHPVAHALVLVWQTAGANDQLGQGLQAEEYTNATGEYTFTTVMPVSYQQRAPHINFSLRATDHSPILTTQVFFADNKLNKTDSYYDDSLLFSTHKTNDGLVAHYNFVIEQ